MSSLVGRESELGAVETFLRAERPCALAIVGEPGIGKTTLWQAAVEHARARGARLLIARPTESEARLAFAGLADLLADVPDELFARLPEPQRVGLDAALLRAASARPPERRVVGAGFLTLLRALAGESEVVCAIDDLQWLDASSAAVVEFALRRIGEEPVRGLLSVRATELARAPIPALDRDHQVEHLVLGPLSVAALHRVLTQELGRTFPRPTLVRIAQATDGNALYAIEIARELARGEHDISARVPVPQDLDALVRARVRALPTETRDALLRAAALARPDTETIDPVELAPAEEAGLVRVEVDGRIEFVHPLFASAVYSAAPAARLREAHRAVADLARDPEERARHLALAAAGPDDAVVRELQAAARHARMRGSPDSAAELTGLALRLLPANAPARLEVQLELAEQLHLASDFAAARALLEELRTTLEPGDLRARALLTLVEIDYWRSGESAATALAEEALADARDPVLRARCHAAVALYAGTVDLPKAAASAREALALLENVPDPDPGLVAAALSARVRADLFLGDGFDRETALRAFALEESSPPATVDTRVVFKLGQWLRYIDDFDGARAALEQAEQQAHEEGDESSLANILLNRVIVATWARRPGRGGGAGGTHAGRLRPTGGRRGGRRHLARVRGRLCRDGSSPSVKPLRRRIRGIRSGQRSGAVAWDSPSSRPATRPPPTGTWRRRSKCSNASPSASRRSGESTATRSRRRWRSVTSTGRKDCSPASKSERRARASRGASRSRRGAAGSCSRRRASSTRPRKRSSVRSPSTRAARCRSSAHGPCSSKVGCSAG